MLLLDRFHFSRAIFMKLHLDCLDVKDNLQAVGCRLVDSELVRTTKPTKHSLFSCSFIHHLLRSINPRLQTRS